MEDIKKLVINIFDSQGRKIRESESTNLPLVVPHFGDRIILDRKVYRVDSVVHDLDNQTLFITMKMI